MYLTASYNVVYNLQDWKNVILKPNSIVIRFRKPNSIYTGKTLREIAEEQGRYWLASEKGYLEQFAKSDTIKNLNADSICIDCGANVGKVSEIMAKTGAKVYAFEPSPLCLPQLEETCSKYKNIEIIKKGVAAQKMKCKLYHNDFVQYNKEIFSQSSSICASKRNVNTNNYTEIECIDLCEFINKLGKNITVLKMDIEGAEFDILYKMINEGVYKKIATILVETHDGTIPEIVEKGKLVRQLIKERNIKNINLDWH